MNFILNSMTNTFNWVLLEEGYPIAAGLSYEEAKSMKERFEFITNDENLSYSIFFDEYCEYTDIIRFDEFTDI